jgi:hypothetical protein
LSGSIFSAVAGIVFLAWAYTLLGRGERNTLA